MKKRVVAKAQKRHRRNREREMERVNRVIGIVQANIAADESAKDAEREFTAEQLRLRAVKRAKEAGDESRVVQRTNQKA